MGFLLDPIEEWLKELLISGILGKLDLRDRTQLAIWAVQTGAVNQGMFP